MFENFRNKKDKTGAFFKSQSVIEMLSECFRVAQDQGLNLCVNFIEAYQNKKKSVHPPICG